MQTDRQTSKRQVDSTLYFNHRECLGVWPPRVFPRPLSSMLIPESSSCLSKKVCHQLPSLQIISQALFWAATYKGVFFFHFSLLHCFFSKLFILRIIYSYTVIRDLEICPMETSCKTTEQYQNQNIDNLTVQI